MSRPRVLSTPPQAQPPCLWCRGLLAGPTRQGRRISYAGRSGCKFERGELGLRAPDSPRKGPPVRRRPLTLAGSENARAHTHSGSVAILRALWMCRVGCLPAQPRRCSMLGEGKGEEGMNLRGTWCGDLLAATVGSDAERNAGGGNSPTAMEHGRCGPKCIIFHSESRLDSDRPNRLALSSRYPV